MVARFKINQASKMNDYKKYEQDCKTIRKANKGLLGEFETWLKSAGFSQKTIANHLANIDFYINEYLLYEEATEAKDGVMAVNTFLGYWFVKKALWASRSSIRSYAASLKKFYTFMYEKGMIDQEELAELKETLKEGMPEWLATLDRYDDPSVDDVWQY